MLDQALWILGNAVPVNVLLDVVYSDPELLISDLWVLHDETLATFLPILQITIFEQGGLQSEDVVGDDIPLAPDEMLDVGFDVDLAGIQD
jgi:hypothetical protein